MTLKRLKQAVYITSVSPQAQEEQTKHWLWGSSFSFLALFACNMEVDCGHPVGCSLQFISLDVATPHVTYIFIYLTL